MKGNFFEIIMPPVECPECKHPTREFGPGRVCSFCGTTTHGKLIVCGKKVPMFDYHDLMDASVLILSHLEHAKNLKHVSTILSEGLFIQTLAVNCVFSKAQVAIDITEKFAKRTNAICKVLGIKEEDFKD